MKSDFKNEKPLGGHNTATSRTLPSFLDFMNLQAFFAKSIGPTWQVIFLLGPLLFILYLSVLKRGPYGQIIDEFTIQNYVRVLDPLFLNVVWNSIQLALITSVSCFLMGYPIAFWLATSTGRSRYVLFILVSLPFWTNMVVRAFSIRALVDEPGYFAVWLGMVSTYLPFMILPIFVALEKLDFHLLEAARDLGGRWYHVLFQILLPLTSGGIVTGFLFVFIPCLGEYVIPDLLGGARVMLIGNLISDQFLKSRHWPFGSALSSILLFVTLVLSFVMLGRQKKI